MIIDLTGLDSLLRGKLERDCLDQANKPGRPTLNSMGCGARLNRVETELSNSTDPSLPDCGCSVTPFLLLWFLGQDGLDPLRLESE